jgi:hypothetical protein
VLLALGRFCVADSAVLAVTTAVRAAALLASLARLHEFQFAISKNAADVGDRLTAAAGLVGAAREFRTRGNTSMKRTGHAIQEQFASGTLNDFSKKLYSHNFRLEQGVGAFLTVLAVADLGVSEPPYWQTLKMEDLN